ncbi:glycosyltransferase family 2 protein [Bernardetia sp. OM2101]|uniref:glycosyltransferase family 2 protein n=1 Tax=Bernardetia sp. OM2101 TaxID=3344876 RepID=UPI0035D125CE
MNTKLTSVIIPAYNCESFIKKTLESVFNQSIGLENLEVIVINDGSTDNTLQILRKYEKEDKIILIDTPNRGVSAARNIGLDKATGDFIQFLDADDYIHSTKIEKQADLINTNNKDICLSDWCSVPSIEPTELENTDKVKDNYTVFYPKLGENYLNQILESTIWIPPHCPLYKKELISTTRFDQNIKFGEDVRFFWECSYKVQNLGKIGYIQEVLTYYVQHEASTTQNMRSDTKLNDIFKNAYQLYQQNREDTYRYKEALLNIFYYCAKEYLAVKNYNQSDLCFEVIKKIEPKFLPTYPIKKKIAQIIGLKKTEYIFDFFKK